MLREAIATGETIEIAFQNACNELGVETASAQMEVIENPVKKTFGMFGGNPAKVKAFYEVTPKIKATEYLKEVFAKMEIPNFSIQVIEEEDGILIKLDGDDIGFIIGHRGDTLDSLQYLTSLVANQGESNYLRVSLDVGNFREKRKETLESLGKKIALKAIKYGKNQVLETMNPYERRIIHFAVQSVEGAKSWSEGEDLTRHVVIGPVDGERKYSKPRYNNDRRPQRNNNNHGSGARRDRNYNDSNEFREKVAKAVIYDDAGSDMSDIAKQSKSEFKKATDVPLYGRIK